MKIILVLFLNVCLAVNLVKGHGYLADPLNRGQYNGFQHSDRSYFNGKQICLFDNHNLFD